MFLIDYTEPIAHEIVVFDFDIRLKYTSKFEGYILQQYMCYY